MSLRIALVESGTRATHIFSRTYLPRVGIPTMGAVLKQRGYDCDIFFEALSPVLAEDLRAYDVVGIGSLTSTIESAYRLADSLKTDRTTVVMGGPHVTFMPREALDHCDYVVLGEGEDAIASLIDSIEQGKAPQTVGGLAFLRADGTLSITESSGHVDFAGLPSPDFSLCPQMTSAKIPPIITTSRGCPHKCTFCSVTAVFGRKYRFKSNEQVISELKPLLHRSVCFGDDNFCADPRRAKSLLREMIDRDAVPLRWSGEMAIMAALDDELLDLMRNTRCRTVYVGIESIDTAALKRMGKSHQAHVIPRCIENLHRHGIGIHGMFVISPDDPLDLVGKIVDYSTQADIDTIQICSLTPFPGTQGHKEYRDRILHQSWRYYDGMHVVVRPARCSACEMQEEIVNQMKRFYSIKNVLDAYRPGRAWRIGYRLGGYLLIRRWARENAGYIDRLRTGYYHQGMKGTSLFPKGAAAPTIP
ncbi:MAG: radical SAM protein [Desulfomonilia bacterium]|jgi:radical SAM superfamily enzyme YgiQ (UPF0313 family)|nr:radical SAM protein [Desulfomonilia bacterium]